MPYKQKLGVEKKIEIIRDYLNNRISMSEAARRGGVARDTISHWAQNYEADGVAAFMTRKNRVYSPELKRQAVEDYLSGMGSQAEICRKYHIRKRTQLQAWIQVYNAHGDFNSVKHSGGGSCMKQGREMSCPVQLRYEPKYLHRHAFCHAQYGLRMVLIDQPTRPDAPVSYPWTVVVF